MSARDSFGFPLAPLTAAEAAARERCLAAGAAASLTRNWAARETRELLASFASNPTAPLPKKLKQLVRAGLPAAERPALWLQLSGGAALRGAAPPGYYDSLVREADSAASPKSVISRAELELFNPFPLHPLLSSMKGMRATRRLVLAHAAHVGAAEYAQGVTSVAAFLLAVMGMGSEEQAFWTLTALTKYRLHPAFYEELRGCRVEQRALEDLARRKAPRVPALFRQLEAPLGEVTSEWMVYLFTRSLPAECAVRVFDCLLAEGPKALHRAGLALLKLHEAQLVSTCAGSLKLGQVLKWRVARCYDSEALMKMAYKGLGSLQGSTIASLRASHEAAIAADHSALASRLSALVGGGAGSGAKLAPGSPSGSASSASLAPSEGAGEAPAAAAAAAAAGGKRPAPAGGALAGLAIPAPPRAPLAPRLPPPQPSRARPPSPPELLQVASLRLLLAGGAGAR